jgi:16S rRNA (cytosine967-C5)-methyltransferase
MWLRVNTRKISRDEYLQQLNASGHESTTVAGLDQAICLERPMDVAELPGFVDGLVSVQDAGAQLAAPWLLADGGDRILDACAAPGGKTGHLLELAGPGAALMAIDVDAERLAAVRQNLERLQLNATVTRSDASNPYTWWDGNQFDRILLDAPCSATGVIRRHPDIRLLRRPDDIASLASQQSGMLKALWLLLEPGGRLLYVTCSVLKEENEAVVQAFLQQHDDAEEVQVLPNNNIRDLMCRQKYGYQVLPGTRGLDGFYFACLHKDSGTKA